MFPLPPKEQLVKAAFGGVTANHSGPHFLTWVLFFCMTCKEGAYSPGLPNIFFLTRSGIKGS